jgi:hypothetical protein
MLLSEFNFKLMLYAIPQAISTALVTTTCFAHKMAVIRVGKRIKLYRNYKTSKWLNHLRLIMPS